MKKNVAVFCALLLFTVGVDAAPIEPAKRNNYWVTETGPCTNPYTVIRLYRKDDEPFLEIVMKGYRLRADKRKMIKRLNRLAATVNVHDPAIIADILCVKASGITIIQKNQ